MLMDSAVTMRGHHSEAEQGPQDVWVRDVLEPDQLVEAKEQMRLGRKKLGRGTRILMWGLRVYVLFMLIVVFDQVWTTLHPAGH